MAVACETMYGPVQESTEVVKGGGIELAATDVQDESFQFTLAPKNESAYYSYLVVEGDAPEALDSALLYTNKYDGVKKGTFKWSKETSSQTVTVDGLTPNTSYQVYAVAASVTGVPGEIANVSVKTTDTVAPGYADMTSEANVITISFSEAVKRNAASGPIKVPYYAYYTNAFQAEGKPAGIIEVPEDSIAVNGMTATVAVPDLPTGALYSISIPEGAFVDVVGQKLKAYASGFRITEEGPAPVGFYGEIDYVELPIFGEMEQESFGDWQGGFVIPVTPKYPLANYSSKKFVTVTYESGTSTSVQTITHTLAPGTGYGMTDMGFVVYLPEQPVIGADVTISIPAGCMYDIYGNDCAAWEHTMLYSYGYTLDDVIGTYVFDETSLFNGKTYQSLMSIEKSNNPEKGNVMFTVFDSEECLAPVYAQFDGDAGTLSIPSQQTFAYFPYEGVNLIMMFVSASVSGSSAGIGSAPVVFNMPEPGHLTEPSMPWGVLLLTPQGQPYTWYDVYVASSGELMPQGNVTAAPSSKGLTRFQNVPVLK